jgi:hypothetical protein
LKWTLLRGKWASVISAALPTVSAFVVVATVIVAVGVMLTSTGRIFARCDKEHGEKKPFRTSAQKVRFLNSPSSYWNTWNTIARPYEGTPVSICENEPVVDAKSDTDFGSLQTGPSIL